MKSLTCHDFEMTILLDMYY